jgi:hypothetical protein
MPVMQYQTFKTRGVQQTECEKLRRQVGEGVNPSGKKSHHQLHTKAVFNIIEKYNKYQR